MKDPRTILISGVDFTVETIITNPVPFRQLTSMMNSRDFGVITLVDVLRANKEVRITKDDGTVITYSMKDRPVDDD